MYYLFYVVILQVDSLFCFCYIIFSFLMCIEEFIRRFGICIFMCKYCKALTDSSYNLCVICWLAGREPWTCNSIRILDNPRFCGRCVFILKLLNYQYCISSCILKDWFWTQLKKWWILNFILKCIFLYCTALPLFLNLKTDYLCYPSSRILLIIQK